MPDYADAKHRPHAVHTGETPSFNLTHGPESISVTLDMWGPKENWATTLYDALQSNWGENPSRTVDRFQVEKDVVLVQQDWAFHSGWNSLSENERAYVESCFAGKTLQQVLEALTFTFTVDGVTRAFTHEYVRARIGSGFMQHGGRDNDWRHRDWTIPETIRRAAIAVGDNPSDLGDQKHCLVDGGIEIIEKFWDRWNEQGITDSDPLMLMIKDHLEMGKELYAMLVDAGIPWQDARRLLPIGTQTYIHGQFNYLALKGVLANRLEHIMDWEINCVTQLMLREIKMKCPPLFSKYLGSHSDLARTAKFDKLESWPPDGKWPSATLRCATCGHSVANHRDCIEVIRKVHPDEKICEVCERDYAGTAPMHVCRVEDTLPRMHRAEQMPFFVLHPDSMEGGPVRWLWTNGNYQDINSQL